jgi:hypothetical protein
LVEKYEIKRLKKYKTKEKYLKQKLKYFKYLKLTLNLNNPQALSKKQTMMMNKNVEHRFSKMFQKLRKLRKIKIKTISLGAGGWVGGWLAGNNFCVMYYLPPQLIVT